MQMKVVIKNAVINGTLTDLTVLDGKIAHIGPTDEAGIDCAGHTLRAGLIDIHTHGCAGMDTMDSPVENIALWQEAHGATSFLPTTMTAPREDLLRVCGQATPTEGAHVLGYHLEGPYLAEGAKGAQNGDHLRAPDVEEFLSVPNVAMVTLAPELDGADALIEASPAVVCIGHTQADYDVCTRAIQKGAKCLTHTCNAMPPFHHRAPGPIGAALDGGIYAQVISDGVHIHPSVVRALYRLFGADRMVLISDSMRATGLPDGAYDLGGQEMTVKNGIARTADGALAGSTSTLLDCVRCAISFGIPADDAFRMASGTPAELLGVNKGYIKVGYDADFILLDSENNLIKTMIFS